MKELKQQLTEAAAQLTAWRMALCGEGNISARVDEDHFLVKASGTSMAKLEPEHLVLVNQAPFLEVIDNSREMDDQETEDLLMDSRCETDALKPSVETLFHAWLLNLPSVNFVGHCHAIAVNRILCSPWRRDFAERRLFPDQVVYCGPVSVRIEYVDPGLPLAREIAREVSRYMDTYRKPPKTILLENHGLITLGSNHREIVSAAWMTEKSAEIFAGAASLGGPVFMKKEEVQRIDGRLDEAYRRKIAGSQ